ncbi:type II toxin-antitoxin system VapC family toxin [Azospirillum sp.]|uniref:type II toxin-antitoxin system VapC family toxin n=1 Tax=Azospirillum sp. TaxID=34012 RepID=UPI003D7356ED
MVIDSSAIIAILLGEPEGQALASKIASATKRLMSASTALELTVVTEHRTGLAGTDILARFLERSGITIVPFDAEQLAAAQVACRRYGKGHHPAALNFGDCFSYALSKTSGLPLLFKGDDFARTDVIPA